MARAVREGSDLELADLHSEKQTLAVLWRTRTLRPRTSEVQNFVCFFSVYIETCFREIDCGRERSTTEEKRLVDQVGFGNHRWWHQNAFNKLMR